MFMDGSSVIIGTYQWMVESPSLKAAYPSPPKKKRSPEITSFECRITIIFTNQMLAIAACLTRYSLPAYRFALGIPCLSTNKIVIAALPGSA
jgi:hypothetical protein